MTSAGFLNYERLYRYRFQDVDQNTRQSVWNVVATDVYRRMGQPRTLLDPAGGRCEFVNALPGVERCVIDILDQAEYRDPEVKSITANLFDVELPVDHFEGVFVSNFLEHLASPDAVAEILVKLRGTITPGGRIAVLGPNFKYCASDYFDCADHLLALTHISVAEQLYSAGFEVQNIVPRYLPFSFRGRLPSSPQLARLYLAMPWAWRILGRQFLVIGTKVQDLADGPSDQATIVLGSS